MYNICVLLTQVYCLTQPGVHREENWNKNFLWFLEKFFPGTTKSERDCYHTGKRCKFEKKET